MPRLSRNVARDALTDRRVQVAAGAVVTAAAGALAARALSARRNGDGEAPSRAYRLEPDESPREGLRRIAAGRTEKAMERLRKGRGGSDPAKRVHGARKDLKKTRAVLRLLRDELGDDRYRAENDAYRAAGRLLSKSRDAEVKVQTLEAICERYAQRLPAGAAEEWLEVLREERDREVEALGGEGSAIFDDALKTVEEGRGKIDSWPLESEGWALVGPGVTRAYKRGRKRMRRVAADPSPEAVHEWRKRAKDLWYQLRILDPATPGLADRVEAADRLADALGDHHDLAVLRDDLLFRELPTVKRAALVTAIADRQEELVAESLSLGERLYAKKPKRFAKKLRKGW